MIGLGSTFAIGILSIVLAIMTLAGFAVYKIVESELKIRHVNWTREGSIQIRVAVYMYLSQAFYLYYRSFFSNSRDYLNSDRFKSGVELAVWFCEGTLEIAKGLGDKVAEKPEILMVAKANRAYHQASRKSAGDIRAALSVVEQLKKYATQLFDCEKIEMWAGVRDTIAWILIRSGDAQKEAEGKIIVNDLFQNDRISKKVKDEIKQNYDNVGVTI